jgi:aminopeptidase-like protein
MKVLKVDYTKEIDELLKKLFPIPRSITGEGTRKTLRILQELVPELNIVEYPSGEKVYDWIIPLEWEIKEAWIKNSRGEIILDYKNNPLHVVFYSQPVHKILPFCELKKHLYYLPNLKEAIPYRTFYYTKDWGFCLSFNDFKRYFKENEHYEVFIDATFKKGSLSIGEIVIKGKSKKEYLISTYICHPNLANDNLSGIIVTAFIAKKLIENQKNLNYSYRIIFVPETIGAISYCAHNEKVMRNIDIGLVITTCGSPGKFGYKMSSDENCEVNQMVEDVFADFGINDFIKYPFSLAGSDERQYSSQAFRINCVTITKDKYYEYPYYHTSLDDLNFVKAEFVNQSLNLYLHFILNYLDKNLFYKATKTHCEVFLSKYELYPKLGGAFLPKSRLKKHEVILYLMFYCDGDTSLYNISKKLEVNLQATYEIAIQLENKGLLLRTEGKLCRNTN